MSLVADIDVSLSTSILYEKQVSSIVEHISEYPDQNLEIQAWNIINDGGVRCIAKAITKGEVAPEEKMKEEPIFEFVECIALDCIEPFEDVDPITFGCTFATDADLVEILANNLLDELAEKEAQTDMKTPESTMAPMMQRLLGKELEINEKMKHRHVEEEEEITPCQEENPPLDFMDYFILTFSDDEVIESDRDLSLAQKLKAKLSRMVKVRKGLTVDSGAADHVMPIGWLVMFVIMKSIGSIKGLHYVAADGTRIANVGQQKVKFMTIDGTWMEILFQLAAIHKPLVSVSKLNESGYKVVFDEDDSYIMHKRTRKIVRMRKERGVFTIDAYVPKNPEKDFSGRR